IENSDWRIDVWDISFSLHPIDDPDSTVYQQFSFAFDMPIDTYFSNYWTDIVLYTIYSRDATCYSIGNYDDREYYHIITNSNGDSLITEDDADEIFDSTQFPDGDYYFKVIARDASLNATADSMLVTFNNGVSTENDDVPANKLTLSNYPNPFNPSTTISFELTTENTEDTEIVIYNLKGQKVKTLIAFPNPDLSGGTRSVVWNGTDNNNQPASSGIYFYKLKVDDRTVVSKKCVLLK
ncbi:MAG: T9SS type A sorting domain-containing protein, partial [Candidatus Cloacimonetes bacterium]|nr:T9SS type A sorting domain-containing protein [Candidatus Cloacimonadota bacterium]